MDKIFVVKRELQATPTLLWVLTRVTMEMVVKIKSALLNTTNTRQIFMMVFEFNFESMVWGYDVYKDVRDATIGETLPCNLCAKESNKNLTEGNSTEGRHFFIFPL